MGTLTTDILLSFDMVQKFTVVGKQKATPWTSNNLLLCVTSEMFLQFMLTIEYVSAALKQKHEANHLITNLNEATSDLSLG